MGEVKSLEVETMMYHRKGKLDNRIADFYVPNKQLREDLIPVQCHQHLELRRFHLTHPLSSGAHTSECLPWL